MPLTFNVRLSSVSKMDFFQFVEDRIQDRRPSYVVTPNLHFARLTRKEKSFHDVIEMADLSLCDSAILSGLLKLKGSPLPARLPGSDMTPQLLRMAEEKGWRIFLFGSDDQTLERIRQLFPKAICGVICPPVHPHLWELDTINDEYVVQIKSAKPDLIFVGLGARKQEFWASKFYQRIEVPVTMCIGASLDFVGGRVRRAPSIVGKVGLEWLWRLMMEPKRLWSRYAADAVFLMTNLPKELLSSWFNDSLTLADRIQSVDLAPAKEDTN
jgi:N-acetylglucosaminyldiphosphoundecaprenol N-acetyl-beta-D-mannosaminyltransferase